MSGPHCAICVPHQWEHSCGLSRVTTTTLWAKCSSNETRGDAAQRRGEAINDRQWGRVRDLRSFRNPFAVICNCPDMTLHGRRSIVLAATVSIAAAIAYNGNIDGNLDTYHEGERLAYYDALESGKLPFRDIFVQHGLGEDIIK